MQISTKALYYQLEDIVRDFDINASTCKTGKNKQAKADAKDQCETATTKAKQLIESNRELFDIWIVAYPTENPFDQENFYSTKYFSKDVEHYMELLREAFSIN